MKPAPPALKPISSASPSQPSSQPLPSELPDISVCPRIVLRHERKGRAGKTITSISGMALPSEQMETVAQAMRRALGCGSSVEDGCIILQGEQLERARTWLASHGAKQIILASRPSSSA